MIIWGIYPGKTGGIVSIESLEGHRVINAWVMPENLGDFENILKTSFAINPSQHVFMEKVEAIPKGGVTQTFNRGVQFGEIKGLLFALKIPLSIVSADQWTRVMHRGLTGDARERSATQACRLFPRYEFRATPRSKKRHEGMTDALLIAEYGRRQLFLN